MKIRNIAIVVGVAVAGLGLYAWNKLDEYRVVLPDARPLKEKVLLKQNWTDAQREQFHFMPQGTRLLPAKWFLALEQPCFSPFGCGMFSDPEYLRRFGFIDASKSERNPVGLPIGFAIDKDFVDPNDGRAEAAIGLTCAACHTGELFVGGKAIQIEGAPAMADLALFQKAVGLAVGFNASFPFNIGRYGRFERRVLGENATESQKAELKARFDAFFAVTRRLLDMTKENHIYDHPAGFMRTDALTRIGNQVFGEDMGIDANYAPANSPVRFPQIWDASWFDWVQYNSSIADPLVRNIGEALGVRAPAKLSGPNAKDYVSAVNVAGVWEAEELLSGTVPFGGLAHPKWPSEFPSLDATKVAAGAVLYKTHCQRCHLPPREELMADLEKVKTDKNHQPQFWRQSAASGKWLLRVTEVGIDAVCTDPRQATDFKNRMADSGDLGQGTISAAVGLDVVTKGIAERYFRIRNFSPEQRIAWSGGRDPKDPRVRAELVYKARPLNGIWAAAPYLHNGSVLTLEALLSSDDKDRPQSFWMGSKEFDPGKVGYSGAPMAGASEFKTDEPGNSNTGHRFKDGPRGKGIIGPALSPTERAQIIEYLKSL